MYLIPKEQQSLISDCSTKNSKMWLNAFATEIISCSAALWRFYQLVVKIRRKAIWLFALLTAAFICGCGYTFAGSKSALGGKFPNIAVRVGQNLTPHSELEARCIESIKALTLRYRDVNLVEDQNKADATIVVNLLSYDSAFGAIGKTGTFDIDEYNVLTYRVDLVDSSGTIVWSSGDQKATSFSALSLAAFDEGGFETLARGYSAKDLRSAKDIASIESDQIFIAFAQSVAETVENALFDSGF